LWENPNKASNRRFKMREDFGPSKRWGKKEKKLVNDPAKQDEGRKSWKES